MLSSTVAAIRPADAAAAAEARNRQARMTKPAGSLGVLEDLSIKLAGLAGECPPSMPEPAAVAVFAGDHGVHAQGVTPWPQEVTSQMVANFLAGGAVVNAFAAQMRASVTVVDVGVATPLVPAEDSAVDPRAAEPQAAEPQAAELRAAEPGAAEPGAAEPGAAELRAAEPGAAELRAGEPGAGGAGEPRLLERNVRRGTRDMTVEPAMTRDEAVAAIEVGITVAHELVASGNRALLTGDMGIANTTASAALVAAFTGAAPTEVTGAGTGIDPATLAHKTDVVRRALELHGLTPPEAATPPEGASGGRAGPADPVEILAAVGGLEHAAIAGFVLGAAAKRVPVILDGVIAGSAALVAAAIAPDCLDAVVAGHRSTEPGHGIALTHLGLTPLVDLSLRLGEGTGAVLALPLVQASVRALRDVATFDSAGVTEKQ
ncbi:nicotinate-nucleotide--dimethylbenzimidazole phosphoribosyltransferase [Cryptosporangium sp. NPDC048952]|uniref:nicotinate-nucleotide--dimethylbenzimidazole phosphoribosyltransferase n=1 Tax=Cryptosporangium sp. NPDC048952 TaxID=3363961 RepID=UPI00371FB006